MISAGVYLKHNTVAEPLFNQWHAWSYLIPPGRKEILLEPVTASAKA